MRAVSLPARFSFGPVRSKRLLALAPEAKLVEQMRLGSQAAFTVAFERYAAGILGFCQHMLGSAEEAEDAVQDTFVAAFRALRRREEREVALKPWLYAIARNRCLSMLRGRHAQTVLNFDVPTDGIEEQVDRRGELRDLLCDLRDLPAEQRAALLLSELGNLSHAEVANVLGCDVANVKALVFRARSGLIARRAARDTPCTEIRKQLANLRGSSLRRRGLRHHLRGCPGCRLYRDEVVRRRRMLAAALSVDPARDLRSSVLAAAGFGSGSAGGGLAAGVGTGLSAALGAGTMAKVAAVCVVAVGGVASIGVVVDLADRLPAPSPKAAEPAPASQRPLSRASVVGEFPLGHAVRATEPLAPEGGADARPLEQRFGAAPRTVSRPDGDRNLDQEQANAAPSTKDAPRSAQEHGHGDKAATPGTAPQGGGPRGEPHANGPDQGASPPSIPAKRGPSPGPPGKGGQPIRGAAEPAPPERPTATRTPPAPTPSTEPPATTTVPKPAPVSPAPTPAPAPDPPPAPNPPERPGGAGGRFNP
jgi:RNA polymerase sigma factor (sigma-70 family)